MSEEEIVILGAGRQAIETSGYCAAMGVKTVLFVEDRPPLCDRRAEEYGNPIHRSTDTVYLRATRFWLRLFGSRRPSLIGSSLPVSDELSHGDIARIKLALEHALDVASTVS